MFAFYLSIHDQKYIFLSIHKIKNSFSPALIVCLFCRWVLLQSLLGPVWHQRDEDFDPGFGRRRKNYHSVPAAGRRGCHHNPQYVLVCSVSLFPYLFTVYPSTHSMLIFLSVKLSVSQMHYFCHSGMRTAYVCAVITL